VADSAFEHAHPWIMHGGFGTVIASTVNFDSGRITVLLHKINRKPILRDETSARMMAIARRRLWP
jgi:hypothetical protein